MLGRFQSDNIRQFRPTRRAIPVWEQHEIIGRRGNYYSVLELRLLRPTIEFPAMALSLSLSNGKSYTYTQVTEEELDHIVQTLVSWRDQIKPLLPDLKQQQTALESEANRIAQIMNTARQMGMQGEDNGDAYRP